MKRKREPQTTQVLFNQTKRLEKIGIYRVFDRVLIDVLPKDLSSLIFEYIDNKNKYEVYIFPHSESFWNNLFQMMDEHIQDRANGKGTATMLLFSEEDLDAWHPTVRVHFHYKPGTDETCCISLHPLKQPLEFFSQLGTNHALSFSDGMTLFKFPKKNEVDRKLEDAYHFRETGERFVFRSVVPWLLEWCQKLNLSIVMPQASALFDRLPILWNSVPTPLELPNLVIYPYVRD